MLLIIFHISTVVLVLVENGGKLFGDEGMGFGELGDLGEEFGRAGGQHVAVVQPSDQEEAF